MLCDLLKTIHTLDKICFHSMLHVNKITLKCILSTDFHKGSEMWLNIVWIIVKPHYLNLMEPRKNLCDIWVLEILRLNSLRNSRYQCSRLNCVLFLWYLRTSLKSVRIYVLNNTRVLIVYITCIGKNIRV